MFKREFLAALIGMLCFLPMNVLVIGVATWLGVNVWLTLACLCLFLVWRYIADAGKEPIPGLDPNERIRIERAMLVGMLYSLFIEGFLNLFVNESQVEFLMGVLVYQAILLVAGTVAVRVLSAK